MESKHKTIQVSSPCFSTVIKSATGANINTSKLTLNDVCTYTVTVVDSDNKTLSSDTYVIDEIPLDDAIKEMDGFKFIPGMFVFGFNK